MKRIFSIIMILGLLFSVSAFSQTANNAFSAVMRESQNYINGCGPEGANQLFITAFNIMSGNINACNQHDIEYMTLGMSKSRADNNLFASLAVSRLSTYQPSIAIAFWGAVSGYGDTAYNNAQNRAREEFRRIHHGNQWNGHGRNGMWHPFDGHVQTPFPQCTQACFR